MIGIKLKRYINIISLCFLIVFVTSGCNKEKETGYVHTSQDTFVYAFSEEVSAFAVNEEALLYTITSELPWGEGEVISAEEYSRLEESGQWDKLLHVVKVYDEEGNEILQKELRLSSGFVQLMTVKNDILYCVASDNMEDGVYAVNTSSWEVKKLAELPEMGFFDNMVLVGDYLYILGKIQGNTKTYMLHPDVGLYNYQGEQICRINVTEDNPKAEKMKIDFPIGIYATEQNTLMIYQYTEEKGFCFLEFNPQEMTLKEHEWSHGRVARTMVNGCGSGYVYRDSSGYLYYGTTEGIQVQLIPDTLRVYKPVVYSNGFVFYMDDNQKGTVTRIFISDIIRKNKEIRVLTDDSPNDFPFGCGYQMTTYSASEDEFALKVLAQDSDFDLYVLDTRNDCAYNLMEKGAFYALNEVNGVQEYLNACFPYCKELAYNGEGDIWMLPVDIDIPGLVYNKGFCAGKNIDYSSMNYMEFMELIEQVEATEPEKIGIHIDTILESMLMQYMSKYDSFDTELFRSHLSKLKQVYSNAATWGYESVYGKSLGNGIPEEFYLSFEYNSEWLESLINNETAARYYALSVFPKLEDGMGNIGTMTLLAVNPESGNLKETLNYVTAYCNYMLTMKNSFVLAEESTYDMDNTFVKNLYEHIAGGSIEFRMADEIYLDAFWKYLDGEISLDEAITEADRKMKFYKGE